MGLLRRRILNGPELVHDLLAEDKLNSIKWARYYRLKSATVIFEDKKVTATDKHVNHVNHIKEIYELLDEDLILCVNQNQPDTILAGLNVITQHFERH